MNIYALNHRKKELNGWEDVISNVTSIITNTQDRKTALQTADTNLEIARLNAQAAEAQKQATLAQSNASRQTPNNMVWYIGGGVLAVALVGGVLWYASS